MSEGSSISDHSFVLYPGKRTSFNAGEYDLKTQRPRYSFSMSVWEYARREVEVEELLIGCEASCLKVWRLHNKSHWPVFVTVTRDGELLRAPDPA